MHRWKHNFTMSTTKARAGEALRHDLWNIMDWGFGTHKKHVVEALIVLLRSSFASHCIIWAIALRFFAEDLKQIHEPFEKEKLSSFTLSRLDLASQVHIARLEGERNAEHH